MDYPEPPTTLSGLIRLSVRDARALDRQTYSPWAEVWHAPATGRCYVCDAGALMAGTLGADPTAQVEPHEYPVPWAKALRAMDELRLGNWHSAGVDFHLSGPDQRRLEALAPELPFPDVPYFEGWRQMDRHLVSMGAIAERLEGAGL